MTPSIAAGRFVQGILLGFFPGAWYGFVRPLGRRRQTLADILFFLGLFSAWLYLSFAVCQGDMHLGNLFSLFLGAFLFDRTFGRILYLIWEGFWKVVAWFYRKIRNFFRKTARIFKKLFARRKDRKSVV